MDRSELESLIASAITSANKAIQNSLNKLSAEVTSLKKEVKAKDTKLNEIENKLDELEQYGRRNNLRIFGVEEREDEETDYIVIDMAKKMNVEVSVSSIDRSHRVGRKGTRPRPIIVKFIRHEARDLIFRSKKMVKGSEVTSP
ncbi:uncharacterized protein LOC127751526 [Frankliniella occidentalis]|uniref:Uncharacterized protein LOC127751526 n=1 Tax=Frankliniella occidentalis TaxID=133901 RepID=A0A9C6X8M3_FRAOC|nr:uncharacterized protein LOC127751526 [Frankliniella occidentalis]